MKGMSKKKIIIYVSLFAVIIAANIYYYISTTNSGEKQDTTSSVALELAVSQMSDQGEAQKRQSVLEHDLFRELEKLGEWPVVPNQVGRANPFLPFFE